MVWEDALESGGNPNGYPNEHSISPKVDGLMEKQLCSEPRPTKHDL